jgi:hypothetical protein
MIGGGASLLFRSCGAMVCFRNPCPPMLVTAAAAAAMTSPHARHDRLENFIYLLLQKVVQPAFL